MSATAVIVQTTVLPRAPPASVSVAGPRLSCVFVPRVFPSMTSIIRVERGKTNSGTTKGDLMKPERQRTGAVMNREGNGPGRAGLEMLVPSGRPFTPPSPLLFFRVSGRR